jgi:hypothetical protein
LSSNYPSQPPRVPPPPPPPPTATGGGGRHGLFYGGCAVAAILGIMAILVVGALIFLVALGSSGGGENPPEPAPSQGPDTTSPGPDTASPDATEPQYLDDVIVDQVGPYTLRNWDYDTADAQAGGALDGVIMTYVHSDETQLTVVVYEYASSDGASEDLDQSVSDLVNEGYEIVDEWPVESSEGEQLGNGVYMSGETEIYTWSNRELHLAVATTSTADYLEEFYQNSSY